jgi:TPP-dependent pyruvate/acetoin dehydrogenase alpha subunit
LIEGKTYRHKVIMWGIPGLPIAWKRRKKAWMERGPIKTFRERLIVEKIVNDRK